MRPIHTETAPDTTPERLQNAVLGADKNAFESGTDLPEFQDLADLDATIDAALECEKFLARRAWRLRKFILNAEIYRDHLSELGRRVSV